MSFETIRINELAKELGLSSKEVLEKFAQISVKGKTHSSTVTVEQVRKLKEFIAAGGIKEIKKPKAFVVKKSKVPETPIVEELKKEETQPKEIEKAPELKVEIVKPKAPVNRLEIVRRASDRPERPERKFPPRGERPYWLPATDG